MKVLNPISGFPSWGSDKETGNLQGIWPWGPARFDYRPSRGLRETDSPNIEGTSKILWASRSRGEALDWIKLQTTKNTYKCWRVSCGSMDWQGLTTGKGALEGPWHHQMVNTEIRLIIFFVAKDGEALYSQQKQDWELTVAQIMNTLLPNSDLNWRK